MKWHGRFTAFMHEPGPITLLVMDYGTGEWIYLSSDDRHPPYRTLRGGKTREESLRMAEDFLVQQLLAEPGFGS